jgi:hypothetical protein
VLAARLLMSARPYRNERSNLDRLLLEVRNLGIRTSDENGLNLPLACLEIFTDDRNGFDLALWVRAGFIVEAALFLFRCARPFLTIVDTSAPNHNASGAKLRLHRKIYRSDALPFLCAAAILAGRFVERPDVQNALGQTLLYTGPVMVEVTGYINGSALRAIHNVLNSQGETRLVVALQPILLDALQRSKQIGSQVGRVSTAKYYVCALPISIAIQSVRYQTFVQLIMIQKNKRLLRQLRCHEPRSPPVVQSMRATGRPTEDRTDSARELETRTCCKRSKGEPLRCRWERFLNYAVGSISVVTNRPVWLTSYGHILRLLSYVIS